MEIVPSRNPILLDNEFWINRWKEIVSKLYISWLSKHFRFLYRLSYFFSSFSIIYFFLNGES